MSSGPWEGVWILVFAYILGLHQDARLPHPEPMHAKAFIFSEDRAKEHANLLESFGPKPTGSEAELSAIRYAKERMETAKNIASKAGHLVVDIHEEQFSGQWNLKWKHSVRQMYSNVSTLAARVRPVGWDADAPGAHAVMISAHTDTVNVGPGGSDNGANVGVLLEVLHNWVSSAHAASAIHRSAVVFMLVSGEEEGFLGAHGACMGHPWLGAVKGVLNLEAMGNGGPAHLFRMSRDPLGEFMLRTWAKAAPHAMGSVFAQDIFEAGLINSDTDFRIYRETCSLSGLDFAFLEEGWAYHTPRDVVRLIRAGSLQALGDNLVLFLRAYVTSAQPLGLSPGTAAARASLQHYPQPVFYNLPWVGMVVQSALPPYLAPGALLASALAFAPAWKEPPLQTLSTTAKTVLSASAYLAVVISWMAGPAVSAVIGALLATYINPLSSFSQPMVLVMLYLPISLVTGTSLQAVFCRCCQKAIGHRAASTAIERVLFSATQAAWLHVLALLVWMSKGSQYFALYWAILPGAAQLIPGTRTLALLVPVILLQSLSTTMMSVLNNMMGRTESFLVGGAVPVYKADVMLAVATSGFSTAALSYLYPRLACWEQGGLRRAALWSSIVAIGIAYIATGSAGAWSEAHPRPMVVTHVFNTSGPPGKQEFLYLGSTAPGEVRSAMKAILDNGYMQQSGVHCGPRTADLMLAGPSSAARGCVVPILSELTGTPYMVKPVQAPIELENTQQTGQGCLQKYNVHTGAATRWMLSLDARRVAQFAVEPESDSKLRGGKPPTHAQAWINSTATTLGHDQRSVLKHVGGFNSTHCFVAWIHLVQCDANEYQNTAGNTTILSIRMDYNHVSTALGELLAAFPASLVPISKFGLPWWQTVYATG
eukprot:CAMPEP_0114228550 /NCGR_PEP_ID=MMETSP0058-20121206/2407_1 /TAXON_ID=36894 /ORGANISM="Pyramimonas parkeae, CCMP726" /LENGTH=879 /DNA_ID=CAMNT_0001339513 /DNA_START=40 /DNA_END=2679 /DNA_ORIENTATION=-